MNQIIQKPLRTSPAEGVSADRLISVRQPLALWSNPVHKFSRSYLQLYKPISLVRRKALSVGVAAVGNKWLIEACKGSMPSHRKRNYDPYSI
jgi:hypothetical protein